MPVPYNILLIVLDDFGVDKVGCYGEGADLTLTPKIDLEAAKGVRFTRAHSATVCSPSRYEMLTGKKSGTGGYWFVPKTPAQLGGYPTAEWEAPATETFLAQRLRSSVAPHAYTCGHFGKWHLHHMQSATDLDFVRTRGGYHRFSGWMMNMEPTAGGGGSTYTPTSYVYNALVTGAYGWPRIVDGVLTPGANPCAGSLTGAAETNYCSAHATVQTVSDCVTWLASGITQPWFASVWLHAPHVPIQWPGSTGHTQTAPTVSAKNALDGLGTEGQPVKQGDYWAAFQASEDRPVGPWIKAMIQHTDFYIGQLIQTARTRWPNTMVVIVGDNGSDAYASATDNTIEAPFNPDHAKHTAYQGGIRVPLIISGGLVTSPNRTSSVLANSCDIYATICDLANVPIQVDPEIYGMSLVPCLKNPSHPSIHDTLVTVYGNVMHDPDTAVAGDFSTRWYTATNQENYKLIWTVGGTPELYNLTVDPHEATDLYPTLPSSGPVHGAYNELLAAVTYQAVTVEGLTI